MANTFTLTLTSETRTSLQAEADAQNLSLERHINEILVRRVGRPHWSDVAENQMLAAELERVTGERDRARDTAARLWETEHQETALVLAEAWTWLEENFIPILREAVLLASGVKK